MVALTVALAVCAGLTLGLLGGGGSILMVPLLVYVAGQDAQAAIATSLLVVMTTSAAAAIPHAMADRVRWRTSLTFGAAGMLGAVVGGQVGARLDETLLLLLFATLMLVTSTAMLLRRAPTTEGAPASRARILTVGAVVGAAAGLVGAGGGFLIVPALVLLGGVPIGISVGTSLVVISMNSAAAFLSYATTVSIDWPLAIAVTLAAVVGSVAGARMVDHIPASRLASGFGWFVLAMSLFVFTQEAPRAWVTNPLSVLAAATFVGGLVLLTRRRASQPDPHPAR